MGRISELWDELKAYHEDIIVLFGTAYVVKEYVIPVVKTLLGL